MTEPTPRPEIDMNDPDDPVLRQRARLAKLAEVGQRSGYAVFGVAMVLFVVGLISGFTTGVTTGIVAALILGSVVLAPTIILGYAVKAADREDRGLPHGH